MLIFYSDMVFISTSYGIGPKTHGVLVNNTHENYQYVLFNQTLLKLVIPVLKSQRVFHAIFYGEGIHIYIIWHRS